MGRQAPAPLGNTLVRRDRVPACDPRGSALACNRPGDVLRARMTIVETRASTSKPDRGTITAKWEVYNQKDELVLTMEGLGMYRRRAAGGN
jgi:hypothetical protein